MGLLHGQTPTERAREKKELEKSNERVKNGSTEGNLNKGVFMRHWGPHPACKMLCSATGTILISRMD